jgi:hypothetical protein
MRIYRSNPLDSAGSLPRGGAGALLIAGVAVLALGAFGLWSEVTVVARQIPQVEQALAASGYGPATVEAARKPGCGRARRLYRWETASGASGTACAGSGFAVTLTPAPVERR